jgi:hypothetical protein
MNILIIDINLRTLECQIAGKKKMNSNMTPVVTRVEEWPKA